MTTLPPAKDPPSASPFPTGPDTSPAAKSADPGRRIVLLLEDNPTDVFVIREVLDSCGLDFDVRVAGNGSDAVQYLQDLDRNPASPCPALVLLDLNVPKADGIEVLRQLRQRSRCQHVPVVVVTSSSAESDRAAVQRLRVEAYFMKPQDLTAYMELKKVIQDVLSIPR